MWIATIQTNSRQKVGRGGEGREEGEGGGGGDGMVVGGGGGQW